MEDRISKYDIETLKRQNPLERVVEQDLGAPTRRPHSRAENIMWHCPFHSESTPSFAVYRSDQHFHCFGCLVHGDVIKYVMERQGLDFWGAYKWLGGAVPTASQSQKQRKQPPTANIPTVGSGQPALQNVTASMLGEQRPEAPPASWQSVTLPFVRQCSDQLWNQKDPGANLAREYLFARGLAEPTLREFMVGYNPAICNLPNVGWVMPGITIPSWHSDTQNLYGVNVRRLDESQSSKYRRIEGSKTAPLRLDDVRRKTHIFVVEGEFDHMLTLQGLRQLGPAAQQAGVLTFGSASVTNIAPWLYSILGGEVFLIATDNDKAGERTFTNWQTLTKRARRYSPVLGVKDVTEILQKWGLQTLEGWLLIGLREPQSQPADSATPILSGNE